MRWLRSPFVGKSCLALFLALATFNVGCRGEIFNPSDTSPTQSLSAPTSVVAYHADHLGSPVLLTDLAGAIVQRMAYSPYGEAGGQMFVNGSSQPLPLDQLRFGFTGQEYDSESGLLYFKARYFDPKVGRFLSGDPELWGQKPGKTFKRTLKSTQAMNAYAYV
jgi:RHS repeat-associated protein